MQARDLEQVRFASMFIGIQPSVDDFSEIIGCLIAFDERSSAVGETANDPIAMIDCAVLCTIYARRSRSSANGAPVPAKPL
jgi:hypothetical protein